MIDTTHYTKTHELYTQFGQWLGVDGKLDSNYFMINYSLHAASTYIKNYYNIDIQLNTVFDKVSKYGKFSPTNSPTKIINVFQANKLVHPTVVYLNEETFELQTSEGAYSLDMDFYNSTDDFYSTYLTGYVHADTSDYSDIDFDDEYSLPSPRISLLNGSIVQSPQSVVGAAQELIIQGTPNAIVLIDGNAVGNVSNSGTYQHSINLTQEVTTIRIKLQDELDPEKTSLEVKELLILATNAEKPYLHVTGYTTKVNTKEATIITIAPIGSSLTISGNSVITTTLVTESKVPLVTDKDSDEFTIKITAALNGVKSVNRFVRVEYNSNLSDSYVHELNKSVGYIPYMPEDLLVGIFKLANHFYTGTLYNNSNVDSYRTANDISQTYTSHTVPSDVKNLLSTYTHFTL